MQPQFPTIWVRLKGFLTGHDPMELPVNRKGGELRDVVRRACGRPVYGMEIVNGIWWAHTDEYGFNPVAWYLDVPTKIWLAEEYERIHGQS